MYYTLLENVPSWNSVKYWPLLSCISICFYIYSIENACSRILMTMAHQHPSKHYCSLYTCKKYGTKIAILEHSYFLSSKLHAQICLMSHFVVHSFCIWKLFPMTNHFLFFLELLDLSLDVISPTKFHDYYSTTSIVEVFEIHQSGTFTSTLPSSLSCCRDLNLHFS